MQAGRGRHAGDRPPEPVVLIVDDNPDILLLLEPISFPIGTEKKDSKSYLDRKAQTVMGVPLGAPYAGQSGSFNNAAAQQAVENQKQMSANMEEVRARVTSIEQILRDIG
jgi:hypothetical protein